MKIIRSCAKEENNKKQNDNFTRNNDATNLCKDTKSIDSGIDLSSLTKLIDDRVDVKLRERGEPLSKSNSKNDCDETCRVNKRISREQLSPPTPDTRKLNIIIHGLKEDNAGMDQNIIKELFDTVGVEYKSTIAIDRLGRKSTGKTRPIRLSMETTKAKLDFMSQLGKLKHGPFKFKRISITDDYTQEEREEIRKLVEEARERSKDESQYVWKVRGSPNASNLRLVRIIA